MTNHNSGLNKIKKCLAYRHDNERMLNIINNLDIIKINHILLTMPFMFKLRNIDRDICIFKMRYGVDYDHQYLLKSLSELYHISIPTVYNSLNKILNAIRRYLIKHQFNELSLENKKTKIYINKINQNCDDIYKKHLLAIRKESLNNPLHIASELASRDAVINKLLNTIDGLMKDSEKMDLSIACDDIKKELKNINPGIYQMTSEEYNKEAIT